MKMMPKREIWVLILSLSSLNCYKNEYFFENAKQLEVYAKLQIWTEQVYAKYIQPNELVAIISDNHSHGVYFSYFHHHFDHPRVFYHHKNAYNDMPYYKKPNLYLIFSDNLEELEEVMGFLHSLDNWHPQAKFILYCTGTARNFEYLIEVLYQHYVFDVVMIILDTLELYTYEPYKIENLYDPNLEPVRIGSVAETDVFLNKKPLFWRNSSVIVTPVSLKPYVISLENRTGIDMDLIEVIGEKMGVDLQYDLNPHYDWGWKNPDGTYEGVFRILQLGQTDFVNGQFHFRDPTNLIDFDYTFSYTEDPLIWAVPCPVPISNWSALILIFAKETWYSILETLLISVVFWQFVGRITEKGRYFSTWYSLEVPFLLFLGISIPIEPRKTATKLMYLSSWLFGFIMTTSWLSHLTASLTHLTYEKPIRSVPEIYERGLILGIHPELANMYGESGDEVGKYILEHFYECDLSGGCWDRVAYEKDMATITTIRILRYITYDKYMSEKGEQLMVIIKDVNVNMDYTVMYFVKGHPMCERVSQLLMWIREGGFINYFDVHVNYKQAITNRRELFNPNQLETKMLSMEQMMASFALLVIGLPVAAVAFVCELCKGRARQPFTHVKIHATC